MEFVKIAKKKEVALMQRSRVLCLKEGDRNSKIFHRTANGHKRYNNIDNQLINEINVFDIVEIREKIISL